MKTLKSILLVITLIITSTQINAQAGKTATIAEIKIKTSATCDMCKSTIEQALAFEKGVKQSNVDVKTKIATVVYNPQKTTPEKIRQAIAKAGYDADDVKADEKAYKKLDDCCKKGKVCEDK